MSVMNTFPLYKARQKEPDAIGLRSTKLIGQNGIFPERSFFLSYYGKKLKTLACKLLVPSPNFGSDLANQSGSSALGNKGEIPGHTHVLSPLLCAQL